MQSATRSIWERIQEYATVDAQGAALLGPAKQTVSYGQLGSTLDSFGELLRQEGIAASDTVAVLLEDGICGLAALLGAARFCCCSPINPALTAAELRVDLLDLGAAAVILSRTAEAAKAVTEDLGLLWIEASLTSRGCEWRGGERRSTTARVMRGHGSGGANLLLHTSATTGRRKIVPLSSANLHAMLENTGRVLKLGRSDRLLMMARIFHTQGILSPFAQLMAGGSVILMDGFTPQAFRTCVEVLQPTWYTCGPTLHRTILTHLRQQPISRPASLRFVRSGGAPLPLALRLELQSVLRVPVLDVYGLTEVGAVACTTPQLFEEGSLPPYNNSVGASMGPAIAILSPAGVLLPPGDEGEIVVGGPTVMSGYRNDPEANLQAFHDGWFRTGDLGRLDPDGLLYVTGRLKEMINRGGQKIIPNDIDAMLMTHPAVLAVAAFAVPHPTLGEDVACAVVLKEGASASGAELRSFVGQQLAAFKIPRKILFLDEIPYGATGKPQRLLLTERFSAIGSSGASEKAQLFTTPTSKQLNLEQISLGNRPGDLQREVAAIWSRYLETDGAKRDEDFFTAGGDSVSAVAMLLEVEEVLGLKTPITQAQFFDRPTLATLTKLASESAAGHAAGTRSGAMELVPVKGGAGAFPLFMVPADGDEGSYFRRLSRRLGERWSLALVRPQNSWHDLSMYAIEGAATEMVALIRESRAHGPYMLGGFCYGGVVAFEAARQLEQMGERVLLVFFDVPMPGSPHLFWDLGTYARLAASRTLFAFRTRRWETVTSLLRLLARRTLWYALRRARPRADGRWNSKPLRSLWGKARAEYFPLYRPAPTHVPVHHFMAQDDQDFLRARSRHGWRKLCISGVTTTCLPGGHHALLSEDNLPRLIDAMAAWILGEIQGNS